MNDILIKAVLNSFNIGVNFKNAVITPFFNLEDGGEYNVWCVKTSEKSFVHQNGILRATLLPHESIKIFINKQ